MSQEQLKKLEEMFKQADNDKNGLLNFNEFKEFVRLAYNKPCPDGMYEYLCNYYEKDLNSGIDWIISRDVWVQANTHHHQEANNNNNVSMLNSTSNSLVQPQHQQQFQSMNSPRVDNANTNINSHTNANNLQSPPLLQTQKLYDNTANRSNSKSLHRPNLSMSNSSSNCLTQEALKKHESGKSNSNIKELIDADQLSDVSERSLTRSPLNGTKPAMRRSTTTNNNIITPVDDEPTSMIMQMMETKLKASQQQLKEEKTKRKNSEKTLQELLITNDQMRLSNIELQTKSKKLEEQIHKHEDEGKKFHAQLNEKTQTITQLTTEKNAMKNERDELLKIVRKIEQENESNMIKIKQKHKDELEQLSNGFLQSLGAGPGKDVRMVIKDLKDSNMNLTQQVDLLSETLARKERSLIEALKAIDDLLSYSEEWTTPNNKSKQNVTKIKSPLPKPPSHRSSQRRDKSFNDQVNGPNAMFFKNALSSRNNPQLGQKQEQRQQQGHNEYQSYFNNNNSTVTESNFNSKTTQMKQMEIVSQKLVIDVVNKQETISSLQKANTNLIDHVVGLQKQLQTMKDTSGNILNDDNEIVDNDSNNNRNYNTNYNISTSTPSSFLTSSSTTSKITSP